MKKALFLFGLFTVSLFAKEIIDGYIKEPFLELIKDEDSFYIKNKNAISFKDNIEINECMALNEQNSTQVTCLTKQGKTIFFNLKNTPLQDDSKILITSPFFKGVLIEPSEILKIER